MKSGLLIFLLASIQTFTLAQGEEIEFDRDYTSLLTSKVWKTGDEDGLLIVIKFNNDGTFYRTYIIAILNEAWDEMGKWQWLQHDTFTMLAIQSVENGEIKNENTDPKHTGIYRIKQIDLQMIKGITYNILESEDSDYVFPFKWVVKE